MRSTAKAFHDFWSQFGIPAYPENSVPDDAVLPYITYDLAKPYWRDYASYNARVWYRDTSYVAITDKCGEISEAIGEGVRIPIPKGSVWIFPDANFLQFQPVEDDEDQAQIKIAFLNMLVHVLSK